MNYLFIVLSSLLGTHLTYWLTHKKNRMSSLRATSVLTLLFLAMTTPLPFLIIPKLQAAFYGATFVGMSEPSRLSEKKVLLAGAVFAGIFIYLMRFKGGIGGTLGGSAFLACTLVYFSTSVGKGFRSEKENS